MESKTLKIRPAKKSDVLSYWGKPFGRTFKGITAILDGEIVGIAGVMHSDRVQAFSKIEEVVKDHPREIVKAVRAFRKILSGYNENVYAIPDTKHESSEIFLRHLGFVPYDKELYIWQTQ